MSDTCEDCRHFDDIADDTNCTTCLPPEFDKFQNRFSVEEYNKRLARAIENYYGSCDG